jgi:hypothetical protein
MCLIEDSPEISNVLTCHDPSVVEITVREHWSRQKILQEGFLGTNLENDVDLLIDLMMAFKDYYATDAGVSEKRVQFFNYIRFTIRDANGCFSTKRLRVGHTIAANIKKRYNGALVTQMEYGKIKSIMIHRTNSGALHPYLVFDWFEDLHTRDPVFEFSMFNLQNGPKHSRRVHPVSVVDLNQNCHFVHLCDDDCSAVEHNKNNMIYMLNEFCYTVL